MVMKVYGDIEIDGDASLYKNIKAISLGHHLAAEVTDGHIHSHAHSEVLNGVTTVDTAVPYLYDYTVRGVLQPDDSGTWTGTTWESSSPAFANTISNKIYFKTNGTAATQPIRFQIWKGTDDTGSVVFDQTYAASEFPTDTEIELDLMGYLEYATGQNYFNRISSVANFSLKINAAEDSIWLAVDYSLVREDNLLQTKSWVDGDTYTLNQYLIYDRQIYICNTAGVQTGTWESNSAYWDMLSHEDASAHGVSDLTGMTQYNVPFGAADGSLTQDTNFTYNGSTLDVKVDVKADKIYLQDSGTDYMGWQSGDGVFQFTGGLDIGGTLLCNDINGNSWTGATIDATDYIETPIIRNTDGDTLTVQDNLSVTGLIDSALGMNAPEFYNSLGDLKLQPDIQGNIRCFGDTDVADNENGKIFYIDRRAPEGNDYLRFYVSQGRVAYIHANNKLTLQAQQPFTINSVTDSIYFKVGDNAGVEKVYFRDSDNTNLITIDSNGILSIDANVGGSLNIFRGSNNNINTFMDSTYTDIRFGGSKLQNRIGTWIAKPFQIVTDSTNRVIIDEYGRVEMTSSLTVNDDITVMDDILAYGDVAARNLVSRGTVVFQDKSTQEEAGERHFSQGHTNTAVYSGNWYDADSENIAERDLHFSPDGLTMYIIGLASSGAGDCSIWEYTLTIPWDLSTAGSPTIKSIETYGSNQVGLFINTDGRRLWTVCTTNDTVIEYSMSPWNISSLSWVQAKDISGQETSPSAVFWSANGDRLFIAGDADNDIVAFSVTSEWDISGISWFEDFGTDIDAPTGLYFSSDGRRMYVMDGSAEDDIHEFHLSSPWMIGTARLVNQFVVSGQNSSPQGIFLTPDNSQIFMVGTSTPDGVYGYDLGLETNGKIIGAELKITNLPTSDPVDAGAIWNDGGTLKVSSG